MSTEFILGLIFLCLSVFVAILKKTYFELPLSELRKRSDIGEENSKVITETLRYGTALRCLLWLSLGLTLAASFVLLARALPIWASIILLSLLLFLIFSLLPNTKVSSLDRSLASLVSPGLNWVLKRTEKYLNAIYNLPTGKYISTNNNIFDTQDLLNFLKDLSRKKDHRIETETFLALERTIGFNERKIKDLMTPAKKVKTLLERDVIGPILINELHESSSGYALVRAEPKGDITGILSINDLNIRSQGSVASHMQKDIIFLSQDDPAVDVIKVFYDTKNMVYVVMSEEKKFVGAINLEAVLKQLTGPLSSKTIAKTDE